MTGDADTRPRELGADDLPLLRIDVTSLVSQRTRRGVVALQVGEFVTQMTPSKAREVAGFLFEAAEAADSDALFVAWAAGMELHEAEVSAMLRMFRGLRAARLAAEQDADRDGG